MKSITEGELWELVENGRSGVNNNRDVDRVVYFDSPEYSSHEIAEVVDEENRNYWILVTIFRIVN